MIQDLTRRRGRDPNRRADLFAIFSGAAAVQETLQLDTMRGGEEDSEAKLNDPSKNTVDVADLEGPTVKSHPWGEMLAAQQIAGKPKVSALSLCVPDDQYFVRFRTLSKLLDAVDVGRAGVRDDGTQEMMLNCGDPAIGRGELDRALFAEIVLLELFRLVAVVGLRPVERVGIDVEHRTVDTLRATQQLRVLVAPPRLVAVVDERLLDVDRIAAARKVEGLFYRDAALVRPGQRHGELR